MREFITEFRNEYRFLSNFYPVSIAFDDMLFASVEHAYQAAKTMDMSARRLFSVSFSRTAGEAKRAGRSLVIRPDWNDVKLPIMRALLRGKFFVHDHLGSLLLATGNAELVEGNYWGDRYWGRVNGVGENHLGRLLMDVRWELACERELRR